ncbi:uncharacterized protein BP5553_10597 [Venustampulla echinocandica]|uniref:Zn(2)-C6 fungal-type domain-containing protein n=1 Tax=Venustampulla echinocandica TaxID=2656787 RepID=A0A370T900_9HELO|nr:uncharacterized protein BP5553_10597 [Venustampulla echinocandica]RDL29970.1 hypothetical protein BP5553_10597 [Venustampulla echinocandica]
MDVNNDTSQRLDNNNNTPPIPLPAPETVPTLAATNPTRKRRRPALSCAECRRRKIKCDRNIPCGQCTQSKSATCTYSPESFTARNAPNAKLGAAASSSGVVAGPSVVEGTADIQTHRVSKNASPPPQPSPAVSDNLPDDHSCISQLKNPGASNQAGQNSGHVEELVQRVQKLEQLLASTSIVGHGDGSPSVSRVPAKDLRGNMSKTRFYGQSHWMHAFAQARKIMCFEFNLAGNGSINLADKAADIELNALINKSKVIARKIKAAQEPQWPLWGSDYKQFMPPRELADRLVHMYLRTYESIHRILHVPSFHKEYAQYWKSPQTAPISSTIKIFLVLAIGTCFYRGGDFEDLRRQAQQWIYAAQSWLSAPNEKGRLNTSTIQVQCLLLLARPIYNIGGDMIWITAGSVMRAAINMGFHRDPKHFPRISMLHGEVRRRLWATILEINIISSLDSGMPPLISLQDFDTEAPANIDDEDISESSVTRPTSKPWGVFTQTSIQLAALSSLPTRLEVTRLTNDFRYEPTYDEVIRLGGELMKTYKENHRFMCQASQAANQGHQMATQLRRKLLDLTTQRLILALHRPFAMKAKTDPRFYYSHKTYLDCAMAVLAHPELDSSTPPATPDNGELQDDYTRLRLVSGGFLKEIIIHAAIVIYLEVIQPLEEDPSLSFSHERKLYRAPFRRLLEEVLELSGQRIQLGETNAKGHLMFSIALAHIDAMETGQPSEEAIIQAARKSITLCCKWLEARMPPLEDDGKGNVKQQEYGTAAESTNSAEWPADDMDFTMQDWSMMDFSAPDTWLFPAWVDESNSWE